MSRKHPLLLIALISLAGLAACGGLLGPARVPTSIPTVTAIPQPASSSPTATSASIPTATQPSAPSQATTAQVPPTAPPIVLTPTSITLPTARGDGNCSYVAKFMGDVTIPDNTEEAPGAAFTKTWQVRNDGTCSWGTAGFALHSLVFVGGDQLGGPSSIQLPVSQVRQGDTVDISVPMTAPASGGTYRSEWMLQVDNGPRIGVGANGITPLYAQIVVNAGAPTATGLARITFAPGATESAVQGSLASGQSQDYILSALQAQTMMLTLTASGDTSLSVKGALGIDPQEIRKRPDNSLWIGLLPVDEDYIIHLTAGAAAVTYGLNVTIPQRITFAPGAIQAMVNGTSSERRTVTFLLRASAGQTMTAALTAPASSSGLTIYGLSDGQPLVRAQSGDTTWTGQLPGSQDYVIEVVPAVDDTFDFSLLVKVQ